ncbi:3'-5' exonuclease [Hydrogenophaga sp. PAMC20947]|uniref:3'-5' exonuclease n=1 Tax=Hydrogenophaga sp. PAMC20947 TaxID=2565558 RepID=UPI00109DD1A4|nr:3'-5' exonuclease [Hydrogenophaga sp. PAMC20947]QCB45186.1 3'-5' exonuclease domain-containing protein 2 [Hydrogenophaga sp. PAMC20947]
MHNQRHIPDADAIAALPEFPRLALGQITLVQSREQAREACAALRDHPALGFDTESKPTFFKDQVSEGPHVVQLASLRHAWIFQLHDPECREQVSQWLGEPGRALAGFGLGDDVKRIVHKLGVAPQGIVELNAWFRERGYRKEVGVKGAVAALFSQRFIKSKKAATSNWASRQLSEGQLIYAANDAYAAAWVYQALLDLPTTVSADASKA